MKRCPGAASSPVAVGALVSGTSVGNEAMMNGVSESSLSRNPCNAIPKSVRCQVTPKGCSSATSPPRVSTVSRTAPVGASITIVRVATVSNAAANHSRSAVTSELSA